MAAPFATDRPLVIVKVAKEGADAQVIDLGDRLKAVSYEDNEKKTSKLSLDLDNQDFRFFDEDTFKKGNFVTVSFGYPGNMQTAECVVERISGSLDGELKVEAEHKGFLLHTNRRSKEFKNATRSEVAKIIATLNGFTSANIFADDTKIRYPHIIQAAMTDAEFLKRLANKQGFEFYVDPSGFHFHEKKLEQAPVKSVRWFTDGVGEISHGSFESESKKKKGRIQAEGLDPLTKETFTVDAKNATVPRASLGAVLEHVDSQTGQTSLQVRVSDDDIRPSTETNAAAAKADADGAFKRHQRSTFKLTLTVVGDPKLHAKSVVEITGIGKRLSGLWYVTKCTHVFAEHYTTKFECTRDGHNGHKGVSKDAKTDGSINKQAVDDGLRQVEVVNERTGETSLSWRNN